MRLIYEIFSVSIVSREVFRAVQLAKVVQGAGHVKQQG